MMRAIIVGFAVLVSAVAGASIAPAYAQSGYDRPGGDYTSATVPNGDPAVCAMRCEHEYSIDRYGGDYQSFETPPDPKGKACADACQAEPRCRAWTYRRPGYGATAAHCYLKETIKPPRHRPCCISGVVR